jgi:spermidine synthase
MIVLALLVLGCSGIVAQTFLLRELLILFSGNELSLGLIIGSWVVSEALGALLGGLWIERRTRIAETFSWATLLFSVSFPVSIYITRTLKSTMGMPPEMTVGIGTVLGASFLMLLPAGLLHGFLFSLSCALFARLRKDAASPTGMVYFFETLGTIGGGLLVSYLFIPHMQAFNTALIIALINGIASLFLLLFYRQGKAFLTTTTVALICIVGPTLLLVRGTDVLHTTSIKKSLPGKNVVFYGNSRYQNIAVVRNAEQYTFFTDGMPVITTPVPDIAAVEELVHFAMLSHPFPERILFLGSGAGGPIYEALKYPSVRQIDYVESDPALLGAVKRFGTPVTRTELADPRVRLLYVDGRRFINSAESRYDVVLLSLTTPSTLQRNRFFTQEFFVRVKGLLGERGILTLTLPGSLSYYSPELSAVNSSVLVSLRSVFAHSQVIPGDTNICLASDSEDVSRISAEDLHQRLEQSGIRTNLLTYDHLFERFHQRKRAWFSASIANAAAQPNRDFQPAAVFYQIAFENLMLSPSLKHVFRYAEKVTFPLAAAALLLLFGAFYFVARGSMRVTIPFAIATTGAAGMIMELSLMFAFQVAYGYVFHEIALLITAFMAGIAAGSILVSTYAPGAQRPLGFFLGIETAFTVFILLMVGLFFFLDVTLIFHSLYMHLLILGLLLVSGLFVGAEFPAAMETYQGTHSLERSVGLLYGADLAGGWLAGLATGFLLFPLLGLVSTCLLVALLKACSLTLLLSLPKEGIIA